MTLFLIALLFSTAIFAGCWLLMSKLRDNDIQERRVNQLVRSRFVLEKTHASPFGKPSVDEKNSREKRDLSAAIILLAWALPLSIIWYVAFPVAYIWKLATIVCAAITVKKIKSIAEMKRRKARIEEDLPRVLDLLVVCIEAGMSLNSAIVRVGEESKGSPLGDQLRNTFHELHVGLSMQDAFKNLADRTQVADVQALATTMIQADQLGLNLGETLRNQATLLRETIRMRTREKIFKVPVKLIFPIIFFIFPAVFTVLGGPAFLQIKHNMMDQAADSSKNPKRSPHAANQFGNSSSHR